MFRTFGRSCDSIQLSMNDASVAPVAFARPAPRPTAGRPARLVVGERLRRQVVDHQGHAGRVARLVEVAERLVEVRPRLVAPADRAAARSPTMCSDHASIVRSPTRRNFSSASAELGDPGVDLLAEILAVAHAPQDVRLAPLVAELAVERQRLLAAARRPSPRGRRRPAGSGGILGHGERRTSSCRGRSRAPPCRRARARSRRPPRRRPHRPDVGLPPGRRRRGPP